eukprot:4070297-Amphidinium_carterae.1
MDEKWMHAHRSAIMTQLQRLQPKVGGPRPISLGLEWCNKHLALPLPSQLHNAAMHSSDTRLRCVLAAQAAMCVSSASSDVRQQHEAAICGGV